MRAVWTAAVLVAPALHALGCSASPKVEEIETSSSTLAPQSRIKTAEYLDQAASSWVEKDDWPFVQGGRCVLSCHTTLPYMMVRSKLPAVNGGSATTLATVRGYVEARVNDWTNLPALYAWVPHESRATEAVVNAFALVSADVASTSGGASMPALSATARKALAVMWNEQQPDGSFLWWDTFSLAPWENADARVWGSALADLAVGMAPASYVAGMTTEEKAKLALLESHLRARASDTARPEPLHNRAMILLAASRRPTLLASSSKTAIADAIRGAQTADGSWNAASLGLAVSGGAAAGASSHAYATAFFTHVLAQSGDTVAAARGRAWLEAHRRADGAWDAMSLNKPDVSFNNQLITDAATAWAVMALSP